MASSDIWQCTDCNEPFCIVCDFEHGHCPDCHEALCEACFALARETRRNRCYSCDDPELATVQFPYPEGRKLYKKYTTPKKGQLD